MLYVDTAPHSDSAALDAAQRDDLILIPGLPAILDLEAITDKLAFPHTTGKPLLVVLNAIASSGQDTLQAERALTAQQVETCPVRLGRRVAFARALVNGLAVQEFSPLRRQRGKSNFSIPSFSNDYRTSILQTTVNPDMSNNDFAAALARSKKLSPPQDPPQASRRSPLPKSQREHVGGYFAPEVARRLRMLASEEDTTTQELLSEGLRLMFEKRGISIL